MQKNQTALKIWKIIKYNKIIFLIELYSIIIKLMLIITTILNNLNSIIIYMNVYIVNKSQNFFSIYDNTLIL